MPLALFFWKVWQDGLESCHTQLTNHTILTSFPNRSLETMLGFTKECNRTLSKLSHKPDLSHSLAEERTMVQVHDEEVVRL